MSELNDGGLDNTIWETGGEHAIEDPFHGPSAVLSMLETPPMPLGNGTYYQPGTSGLIGTNLFDANGLPLHNDIRIQSTSQRIRFTLELLEWVKASQQGEVELSLLEGTRQQNRLRDHGVSFAFKSTDTCGGGSPLDECVTAVPMVAAAQEHAAKLTAVDNGQSEERAGQITWNTLSWLGKKSCSACMLTCEVAVQTKNDQPTGITRFANTLPLPDIPTIHMDTARIKGIVPPGFPEIS
jgi:hypothetical protein